MPVKVTSRTQIKARPADEPLRDLCLHEIKRGDLLQQKITAHQDLDVRMQLIVVKLQPSKGQSPKSSRRRLV